MHPARSRQMGVVYVEDAAPNRDPKLVKGALARSPNLKQGLVASEDAQAAFLGGDEAVELLMREVRTVDDEDVDLFASTFGAIRAPSVKKWLASKAKVSRLAAAMLELHG